MEYIIFQNFLDPLPGDGNNSSWFLLILVFCFNRFLQNMAAKLPLPSCRTISKHLSAERTISRFNGTVCLRRAAHSLGSIMHFQLSFTNIVQPYSFRNFK